MASTSSPSSAVPQLATVTAAVLLLMLLNCCPTAQADLDITTIEGSEVEAKPKSIAVEKPPFKRRQFNCIVCDDMKDAHCEPWDRFSHSKNCYEQPRIDKDKEVGCRVMVQHVLDRTYVSRQCTNLVDDSVQGCVERVGTKKIKVRYCHCRGRENCNGADGRLMPAATKVGLLAMALAAVTLVAAV